MFEVLIKKTRSAYLKIKNSFRKIQRAEEKIKKRWLVGLTASAMLIIIGLWLIFINNFSLPNIAPANQTATSSVPTAQKQDSIWQTFKRGLNETIKNIKEQINFSKKYLEEQLQKNNETFIENQNVPPLTAPLLTTTTIIATSTP